MFVFAITALAQGGRVVKGTVADEKGQSLPGVTVIVKGTTNGTITDVNGGYSMQIPSLDKTLVFSFVGMVSQEVELKGRERVDVRMQAENINLEDVVVIGYGTARKKDVTGSVVQVKPDNLQNENPQTVQDVLRGVPGLKVGYTSEAKGGGSLQIRGQTSVYSDGGHNDPLIILDGMQFYGELSEISTDDIAQIDVLKDASATAVYGSKAASGVIIITTKKGKRGKPVINFNANLGINTKSAYRDVYDANGYLKFRQDWETTTTYGLNKETGAYEAYQTGAYKGMTGYFSNPNDLADLGVSLSDWIGYQSEAHTEGRSPREIWGRRLGINEGLMESFLAGNTFDWYDNTFRTGINQDYNVNVSGASENINYYLSLGYLSAEGAVRGNDYETIRANMKVSGKVTDWFEIGANVNFQDRSDGDIRVGTGTNYWDSNQVRNSPFAQHTDASGAYIWRPMGEEIGGYSYDFERQYKDLEKGYTVLNTILNAKVSLPFGITYSFNVAPRYEFFYDRYFESADHPGWNAKNVGVNRAHGKRFDWNLNNTLTWDKEFNEKHRTVVTLVQEAEERRYWSDFIHSRNILPSDALGFHNTSNGTKEDSSFGTTDTHQTADGLMARAFYSYDDRYMFTATIRRDGYSAFGASNPYAYFPSFAFGWNFKDESFINWDALSTGKLRLSWGKNGNRSLSDPYISIANLGSGTGATMGYINPSTGEMLEMKYLGIDRLANPNLQWEKTESLNMGVDYGFFNNRIFGTFDVYFMKTHDMIMNQRLPAFSGFGSIATNLGRVDNRGFEISVNTLNVNNSNFEWTTNLAFSYNKNEIKALYGNMEDVLNSKGEKIGEKEADDIDNSWFIGQPIGAIWDYQVVGVWQKDEVDEAARYGQKPGDPKVANNYTADDKVNADGSVTPIYNNYDKVFMGQTAPPINWSLRNDFKIYKSWEASINIYSYMGHKSLNGEFMNGFDSGSMYKNNYNPFVAEYWTIDNPTNEYARLNAQAPAGASARKLINRNFIRLDNISLAYTLPKHITERWKMDRVKVSASIRNVATWAQGWEYGDPETGGLATRTYNFGINVTL